jgi:chromosome segregation ATPase
VVFLLDEIDAHVDPRNLDQFAKAILSQKEESQIIFVTLPRDEVLAKMADYLITIFFRNGVSRPIVIPKERISEVLKNR